MDNILDLIVARKRQEIAVSKQRYAINDLEKFTYFNRACSSLKGALADAGKTGIIAEYKRKSPSKGIINDYSKVDDVVLAYAAGGASAISILTDYSFFGGAAEDLMNARAVTETPLLRKDFMIDPYQIYEAKAWGADVILLIAAILSKEEIDNYGKLAHSLGLSVLLEVHDEQELLTKLSDYVDVVGVNNRNLKDFSVNLETSFSLIHQIPEQYMKVSESAISTVNAINELKRAGFNGFLIGECFMKDAYPGEAFKKFVDQF